MASRHAARGKATRLLGGIGGMLPRKLKKIIMQLGAFGVYFAAILTRKNCKNVHFLIDIVLLRTIFRGIGAYSRMFVYCAIGASWNVFSKNAFS